MQDATTTGAWVALLIASYPRHPMSEATIDAYRVMLRDVDPAAVLAAVERLVKTSVFPPTIADIRLDVAEAEAGLPTDVEAWELAMRYVLHKAEYVPCPTCPDGVGFVGDAVCRDCRGEGRVAVPGPTLDPVIRRALDYVGGKYGILDASEVSVVRAQFRDAYRELRGAAIRDLTTGLPPPRPAPELSSKP